MAQMFLWGKYSADTKWGWRLKAVSTQESLIASWGNVYTGYVINNTSGLISVTGSYCEIANHVAGYMPVAQRPNEVDQALSFRYPDQPNMTSHYVTYTRYVSEHYPTYTQGTYLTSVTAEANTYPQNGRHSDGFWYVYQGLANKAPTISGTDTDLGTVTELLHKYSINDTDPSDVITVTERLDGVQLRTFTATREVEYTISILAESGNFTASKRTNLDSGDSEEGAGLACWIEVLNGTHKLTITATDNIGASTVRTVSFTKAEHELEFTLQTPLAADDLVTKTIMSITRQLPVGALMQIYVCNNGFDEVPTWEDITAKVEQGDKFFFANTVKTADKWGYNLRVCVQRLGAEGTVFITSVGGNFE